MWSRIPLALLVTVITIQSTSSAQTSSRAAPIAETFDVVSIVPSREPAPVQFVGEFPNGAIKMPGSPMILLLMKAFPEVRSQDMVGLPEWVRSELYTVIANARDARPRTRDQRTAMIRAMLAERMKLAFHWEQRERNVLKMVVARRDRKLGPQLRRSSTDCTANANASGTKQDAQADSQRPATMPRTVSDFPPPEPCAFRNLFGALEGDTTMSELSRLLRGYAGSDVVDGTELRGYYHVRLTFDPAPERTLDAGRGNEPVLPFTPAVFSAVREQLGLQFVRTRMPRPTLIIDHLERPSPN